MADKQEYGASLRLWRLSRIHPQSPGPLNRARQTGFETKASYNPIFNKTLPGSENTVLAKQVSDKGM